MNCNGCTANFETGLPTSMVYGDTMHWIVTFKDDSGAAIDTSGFDMYLILRDGLDAASSTFIRTVTTTVPSGTDDALAGRATITLAAEDSKDIPIGKYYYEFKRVITSVTPVDVFTFASSSNLAFEVKPGTTVLP